MTDNPVDNSPLTEVELQVLEIAGRFYKYAGAKESAIREELDMSATRFYQVLNAVIDKPAALAAKPVLVHRLQRLRELRRVSRGPQGKNFGPIS